MFKQELIRKLVHIFFGIFFIVLSLYFSQKIIIIISLLLMLIALIDKVFIKKTSFIYKLKRYSIGTILYPLAVAILAWFWLPNFQDVFIFSITILAFSDSMAALVGSLVKKKIPLVQKTIHGSTAFFITTVFISLLLFRKTDILPILLNSLILTIVEFIYIYGFDNLAISLTASYLFYNFNY